MAELVKCRFAHCLHESKELEKSDAVRVGNAYYHKDCQKVKDDILTVNKLFSENINSEVVFSQLNRVVNNIIFEKKVSSEYLVFALKYYIVHKIPLNYPQGLYYVIQNRDVKKAWNELHASRIKKEAGSIEDDCNDNFGYAGPKKQKSFADIFGG